jgi:hypothetical protein
MRLKTRRSFTHLTSCVLNKFANERLKAKIAREGVTIYPENRESYRVLPNALWKFPAAPSRSLLVVFYYLGRPHMGLIWITSGVPQSLTLPQQIPALI